MGPFFCCYFGSRPMYAYSSSSLHEKTPICFSPSFSQHNKAWHTRLHGSGDKLLPSSHQSFIEQLEKRSVSVKSVFIPGLIAEESREKSHFRRGFGTGKINTGMPLGFQSRHSPTSSLGDLGTLLAYWEDSLNDSIQAQNKVSSFAVPLSLAMVSNCIEALMRCGEQQKRWLKSESAR